ncbi:hypothetical protein ID866_6137 [Astraeus odoratus]|nr:hypothetical protein ID866_6137 [Astraeus odoratus]
MADKPEPNQSPVDSSIYDIKATPETVAFMKSMTGIQSDDKLRAHILDVQAKAYSVCRSLSLHRHTQLPKQVLEVGQRGGALLMEVGCCFGLDMRRVVVDGFPVKQIIASDLRAELWELGHVLCRSTPESFPVTFLAGDVFDPEFLSPLRSETDHKAPLDLPGISTLNALKGRVHAIYAKSIFHLFNEEQQYQLAHALGSLLSHESGSVIFGSHVGDEHKGLITHKAVAGKESTFSHSPSSWKELWSESLPTDPLDENAQGKEKLEHPVFRYGEVRVEASIRHVKAGGGIEGYLMDWSITRL